MKNLAVWTLLAGVLMVGCAEPPRVVEEAAPVAGLATDAPPAVSRERDWPWWRGPGADGTSHESEVTTSWGPTKNVVWKADVPGRGHSSPIVCGDRVFLTTADENAEKQLILAHDRMTGEQLWSTVAHEGGFGRKHQKNSHASATPACDGERVYCVFANRDGLRVTATDLDGGIAWQTEAGRFGSEHGYGSSPVVYKSVVIVLGDSLKSSFVAALDRRTGEVVWRTARKTTGRHASYATPIVAEVAGKPQLLVTGQDSVSSYDPDTGKLIWSCNGPAEVTACTAAFSDQLVFASGGFPVKELLAIRADGSGDVTTSHVVWRTGKGVTYVPSPLFHDGYLYVVNDNGISTCFEAATGNQVWQGRLQGDFSASPTLAGDLLFATNEAGKTFVLRTGSEFEVVAENDLGDGGFASPAICRGQIFLRTNHNLYCIGHPAKRTESE